MDATTMPKTDSLVKALVASFPELTFEASDEFRWSPKEQTVYFCDDDPHNLLHETAHGLLGHTDYNRDVTLLKMERDAWTYAQQELGPQFDIKISEDTIEDALDSYRDWLHTRSRCPQCRQTGIQTDADIYSCLGCNESWRTNEARTCGLRRYQITPTKIPAS